MSLTAKQKIFCAEYMVDLNATQAAIRAGYSKKTAQEIGSQNLSKLIIQQEVQKLMSIRAEKTATTAENVIKGILAVIEDAKAMKETDVGRSMTNHTAALKGYELLGKHLAMWTDKKITESTVKVSGINIVGVDGSS